jgi:hypothetical protein
VALRLLGFRTCHAMLARLSPAGAGERKTQVDRVSEGKAVARLIRAAARHGFYRASCLPCSLTLWWVLRQRGIPSDLRIGVRKEGGQLQAHAWVEFRGTVLNDGADVSERYATFDRAIAPAVERS